MTDADVAGHPVSEDDGAEAPAELQELTFANSGIWVVLTEDRSKLIIDLDSQRFARRPGGGARRLRIRSSRVRGFSNVAVGRRSLWSLGDLWYESSPVVSIRSWSSTGLESVRLDLAASEIPGLRQKEDGRGVEVWLDRKPHLLFAIAGSFDEAVQGLIVRLRDHAARFHYLHVEEEGFHPDRNLVILIDLSSDEQLRRWLNVTTDLPS